MYFKKNYYNVFKLYIIYTHGIEFFYYLLENLINFKLYNKGYSFILFLI